MEMEWSEKRKLTNNRHEYLQSFKNPLLCLSHWIVSAVLEVGRKGVVILTLEMRKLGGMVAVTYLQRGGAGSNTN